MYSQLVRVCKAPFTNVV
jgi:hypothetical protein